ncbi:MAG: anthranilate synthase component I family protein [Planctomycetes bacterium]|nr:anthranilate synthase component I family protein [Planctomycetota bacterium]MBU1517434.1 anthranilate synthase component I family protein [Planctomycetota bacterium]MBU2457651.1 anthranilate synthase component I family protein [Planctomycetota bacterium]
MVVFTAEPVCAKECRFTSKKISVKVELQKLVRYFSSLDNPSILGAAGFRSERNRYSYFAAEPVEVFEISADDKSPFEKLRAVLKKYHLKDGLDGVFTGGWIGFFSYDLNRFIENIPASDDDIKLPLIRLCFYDKVICFDHLENSFHLFAIELPGVQINGKQKIANLEDILNQAANTEDEQVFKPCDNFDISDFRSNPPSPRLWRTSMTKDSYLDAIAKTKKHIYDGDVYQINFSQRFSADFNAAPFELFLWQNKFNPSPYSAFIDAGDYKIVSASPELFININNGTITTCPIKGTRPRMLNETVDEKNYNELVTNEKEKAELDMIIDLERNDLGRICRPGSIKVVERRAIEAFATVFHAVATIQGQLKEKIDFTDILKAIFPGGSISGAPKISAMKIINGLEPTARGLYTGSIGWLDLKGNACLNIAIRTIIIKDNLAFAQTGGGIVADSDPQAEWNETLIKAKALLAGINAVNLP